MRVQSATFTTRRHSMHNTHQGAGNTYALQAPPLNCTWRLLVVCKPYLEGMVPWLCHVMCCLPAAATRQAHSDIAPQPAVPSDTLLQALLVMIALGIYQQLIPIQGREATFDELIAGGHTAEQIIKVGVHQPPLPVKQAAKCCARYHTLQEAGCGK